MILMVQLFHFQTFLVLGSHFDEKNMFNQNEVNATIIPLDSLIYQSEHAHNTTV